MSVVACLNRRYTTGPYAPAGRLYANDAYANGMMQAILIGQSFQLQKVWTAQYRSTGTFHALVISGTHVAVLAAFFLFRAAGLFVMARE